MNIRKKYSGFSSTKNIYNQDFIPFSSSEEKLIEKIEKIKKENKELEKKNKELEKERRTLVKLNLKKELEKLEQKNKNLKEKNLKLKKELEKERIKELEEIEEREKKKNKEFEKEKKRELEEIKKIEKNLKLKTKKIKIESRKRVNNFKKNLYNINHYLNPPIPISNEFHKEIIRIVIEIIKNEEKIVEEKFKSGFKMNIRMFFIGNNNNVVFSKSFKVIGANMEHKTTKEKIKEILEDLTHKHFDTINYSAFLGSVEIWAFKNKNKGGCNLDVHSKVCEETFKVNVYDKNNKNLIKFIKLKLISLTSRNNNCGIVCLLKGNELKANEIKPDKIRKDLGIELNTKLDLNQMELIADYLHEKYNGKGFIIFNEKCEILKQKFYNNKEFIEICLWNEHYWMVEKIEKKRCEKCGKVLRIENKDHNLYCNPKNINFIKTKDRVKKKYIIEDEKLDYSNVIFFDLETFQEENKHVPYACRWINGHNANIYKCNYGKNCMKEFVDELCNSENKIITAYNGSGFD